MMYLSMSDAWRSAIWGIFGGGFFLFVVWFLIGVASDTNNEVIDHSPSVEWLYKCDCPRCKLGMHYDKDIAESYRKRGELNNEVARLRGLLKDHATFLRKNGFDRQADDLMRHAPAPEETQDGATLYCVKSLLEQVNSIRDEIQKLKQK
jgi:hypothetical protein